MTKQIRIATAVIGLALITGVAAPALAAAKANASEPTASAGDSGTNFTLSVNNDESKIANFIKKADQEIARRIDSLKGLNTRTQAMKKVSSAQKTELASTIQSQLSTLNSLKAKIDADTDLATVKADVQSITKSYRIFALVIPQGSITAAADRIMTITDTMTAVGTKLQTRISSAQTAGKDVSSLSTLLTDYNAKISDAKSQAQAAITEISSLTPDGGDKTKMEANTKALKDNN